jgi:hypothetical protein
MAVPAGITPPPTAPSRSSPSTFDSDAEAFVAWFPTFLDDWANLPADSFFPVQSTLTDATPDRVLLNGGHGIGGNGVAPPNFNLDDITVSGIYNVSSSVIAASALPGVTIQSGASVLAMVFNTSNQAQMLIVHPGGKLFHRIKDAGVWTGWFEGLAVDPVTGRVGVGVRAPTGILEVNNSRQFDPADASSNSHLNIVQAGGTPGEGNYGASVVLSKIASGRPGGAMASVQTGPDPDQMGLSFFTHLSSTASDILAEQFRIDHSGAMLARVWEGVCAASGLGAPMETGSNANGQYFRFANGLQICLVSGLTEFASNTSECTFNGSFPAAFLAGSNIYKVASIMDNRAHADITFTSDMDSSCEVFSRYDTNHSNASYFLRVRAPSGTFTSGVSRTKVQAIFVGRWK